MLNRSAGHLGLLGICALLAVGCLAAEDAHKADAWQTQLQNRLQEKITVALDEATLDDALANFRQFAHVPIIVDPGAVVNTQEDGGDINLVLSDVPLADALPKVLEPLGLQYALHDEAIFVFRRNAYSDALKTSDTLSARQLPALEAAIKDLASDDFAVRERADAALFKLGPAAAQHLARAARASTDPEAQLRLRRLQERFTAKPFPELQPEVAAALDKLDMLIPTNFEATHVGEAVAFVSAFIDKKTGKPPHIEIALDVRNKTVSLAPAVMHAGNVLRWLAFLSNTRIVMNGDALKFVNPK